MRNLLNDASILKKYVTGEANSEEEEKAYGLLQEPEVRKRFEELGQPERLQKVFGRSPVSGEQAFERFAQQVGVRQSGAYRRVFRYVAGVAAVAVLGVASWALWPVQSDVEGLSLAGALDPGLSRGTLVLADGREVEIGKGNPGDLSLSDGDVTVSYEDGCLSYQAAAQSALGRLDRQQVESYNQFVIPSGAENTLLLSDGTRVRLNAESKLIYPEVFVGTQRVVFLEGEAFFDVVSDESHPFIVQTRMGDIEVLGTRFNVNVYPEDTVCYTTLVEGRVAVNLPSKDDRMFLAPGQQAVFSGTHAEKREVNLEEYVGWVDGVYTFRDKKLRDIMQTFERWYNIDVVYEDASLADIPYTGSVKRYESILPFLEALQLTTDLHCRIEGRNVYLSKAQ